MKTITIIGAGMMGSALAFPARENGNTVRIVGTPLDREIIEACRTTNRHPKFTKDFPESWSRQSSALTSSSVVSAALVLNGMQKMFCPYWTRRFP